MNISENFIAKLKNLSSIPKETINICDNVAKAIDPTINIDIKYCYKILLDDNSKLNVSYKLTYNNNEFKPYGIESTATDNNGKIIEYNIAHSKFSTIDECVNFMKSLAKDIVLPSNLEYGLW